MDLVFFIFAVIGWLLFYFALSKWRERKDDANEAWYEYWQLKGEVARLKRDAMCHNLDADDRSRFKAGCEQYRYQLFGE